MTRRKHMQLPFVVVFAILASGLGQQLQYSASNEDVAYLLRRAQDALVTGTSADVAKALEMLNDAGELTSLLKGSACRRLNEVRGMEAELRSAAQQAVAANLAGCQSSSPPSTIRRFTDALGGATLVDLASGAAGLAALDKELDGAAVIGRLEVLMTEDGVVSGPAGSVVFGNGALMVEALRAVASAAPGGGELVKDLAGRLVGLLPTEDKAVLGSDPSLYGDLCDLLGSEPTLSTKETGRVARELVALRRTADLAVGGRLLRSLRRFSRSAKGPVAVTLINGGAVHLANGEALGIEVRDVLGAPLAIESAKVTKATDRANKAPLLGAEAPMSVSSNTASLAGASIAGRPCVADLRFEIKLKGRQKAITPKRTAAFLGDGIIKNVIAGVTPYPESDDEDGRMESVSTEGTLSDRHSASAADGHYVHVMFEVQGAKAEMESAPHQSFVRFRHTSSGLDTFFVAQARRNGQGFFFESAVSVREEEATFLQKSGAYRLSLLVGDRLLPAPITFDIGTVEIMLPPRRKAVLPIYKEKLLQESDTTTVPLEEKFHTFRPAPKLPPTVISVIFALAAAAPVVFMIVVARRVTKRGSDAAGSAAAEAANAMAHVFVGCIAAIFMLFTAYWLAVPIVDKMEKLLLVLVPFTCATVAIGHRTLKSLVRSRLEAEKNQS